VDPIIPRANESVSLLVTGSPNDRRVIVHSSDARSLSSDSTYTGSETRLDQGRREAYTMKDRDWHRELVEQYQHQDQSRSTTSSRYHTKLYSP